ncbi:uncharacterized protein LOC133192263 [Saccostrea echinata]|uniref:uncharacterized protein LOC133192263 n=1 Tax=Saccostrea echinata TaxID=191078 RepID=UPI002A7FFA65|nr:uncharacterized protein LOC133192263 [Saccostrea echinata]
MESVTPRKLHAVKKCLVCCNFPREIRKVESAKIRGQNLKDLLKKYGGVNIESGIVCRNCFQKLDTLDQKCREFYENCQKNATGTHLRSKRMASSPAVERQPEKRSLVGDTAKKAHVCLFPMQASATTISSSQNSIKKLKDMDKDKTPVTVHDHDYYCTSRSPSKIPRLKNMKSNATVQESIKFTHVDHTYTGSVPISNAFHPQIENLCKNITSYTGDNLGNLTEDECTSLLNACQTKSLHKLSAVIIENENLKKAVIRLLMKNVDYSSRSLNNRKHSFVSKLMKKSVDDLKSSQWIEVVTEFQSKFPHVFSLIVSMMLRSEDLPCFTKIQSVIPRLAMVYGIIAQTRNVELSHTQRVISMLLFDNICDQKVFDRLQKVGVCLSYAKSLKLVDQIGGHFNDEMVELVRKGRRFRIVGDNINWKVGVHDQRIDNKDKFHHAFGSAILVQNINFDHLSDIFPQREYKATALQTFLPSVDDMKKTKRDYAILIARVAIKFLPFFEQFESIIPRNISKPCSLHLKEKTHVIPMPVLFRNEQYYQDVVHILDFYTKTVAEAFQKAGKDVSEETRIHIGGDQLTRERFSGAKAMRAHDENSLDRFQLLTPISFELFHMHMNYLKMVFKVFFNSTSVQEIGTLKSLQNRLSRTKIGENLNDNYDSNKDFFISVVDAYIIECIMEFFGMDDQHSRPTKHIPEEFGNDEEKQSWFFDTIGEMLDRYIFPTKQYPMRSEQQVLVDGTVLQIKLPNAKALTINIPPKVQKEKPDGMYNYGCQLLEVGLLFKDLIDLTHLPDRERGIRLLKIAMLYFKTHNNLSKYAYEIMRFLVYQECLLSEKAANEMFYGLFVNINGKYDGHIPADRRMEYMVKEVKSHIKHMCSNKTEKNISNRTRAIPGIKIICSNFDYQSSVITRAKKHSDKSSTSDELTLIQDLRNVRPFFFQPGRFHNSFQHISPSILHNIDIPYIHSWIEQKKIHFALDSGN